MVKGDIIMKKKKILAKPRKKMTVANKVALYVVNENCQCCGVNMSSCKT